MALPACREVKILELIVSIVYEHSGIPEGMLCGWMLPPNVL